MQIDELVRAILAIVVGYVVGGIPWGVIVARVAGGPDPRSLGSGRTGGANVLRAVGPRAALASGLLDVGKGVVAVLFARLLGTGLVIEILAALAAILGHSRSPFLGLQGGRGVSAGIGGLLVLQPIVAAVIVPVFALVLVLSRYSSLASLTASAVGGIVVVAMAIAAPLPVAYIGYGIAAPAMIWIFHADNIQRLLRGQERRFGERG
ncbi:MAG TPA: glycerol-3-phosphate 1-O-acyltransferase PlsY [Candidatus Limnocylindrales bacterium]